MQVGSRNILDAGEEGAIYTIAGEDLEEDEVGHEDREENGEDEGGKEYNHN